MGSFEADLTKAASKAGDKAQLVTENFSKLQSSVKMSVETLTMVCEELREEVKAHKKSIAANADAVAAAADVSRDLKHGATVFTEQLKKMRDTVTESQNDISEHILTAEKDQKTMTALVEEELASGSRKARNAEKNMQQTLFLYQAVTGWTCACLISDIFRNKWKRNSKWLQRRPTSILSL